MAGWISSGWNSTYVMDVFVGVTVDIESFPVIDSPWIATRVEELCTSPLDEGIHDASPSQYEVQKPDLDEIKVPLDWCK
jgi:hypothetical protein